MKDILIYIPYPSPALNFAAAQLEKWGFSVTAHLCPQVTHMLLGVPASNMPTPDQVPAGVTVMGGNLGDAPYRCIDFLQDEQYLSDNAAITAHCAIKLAMQQLPVTLAGCKTLLIGWGRISKHLAPLLSDLGADVTVASRSEAGRCTLKALGYGTVETERIVPDTYRLIINTAPGPVLDGSQCARNAVLMDLASKKGICGAQVIWARGLPGKETPESSGVLIARTVVGYLGKEKL